MANLVTLAMRLFWMGAWSRGVRVRGSEVGTPQGSLPLTYMAVGGEG
jgi:hypothetical protein